MKSCSFCEKSEKEVVTLIEGRLGGPYICEACVSLCNEVLIEELVKVVAKKKKKQFRTRTIKSEH